MTDRIRQSVLRAARRALRQNLAALMNKTLRNYLTAHPDATVRGLAAHVGVSKRDFMRALKRPDRMTMRHIGLVFVSMGEELKITVKERDHD